MSKPIEFSANDVKCTGILAEPAGEGKRGAVVVVQEWHGLSDEIKTKVDRFAAEGFFAVAPDLYHGVVAPNDEEASKLMQALDFGRAVGEIGAAVAWAREQPGCNGKVAVVGFCLGGALTLAAAANVPGLACAVPFYGIPDLSKLDFGKVTAPIQAHFAGTDTWAKADDARKIQKDLVGRGREFDLHVYPEAGHAFMREKDPAKFHAPSAKVAWERTLAFLHKHLG